MSGWIGTAVVILAAIGLLCVAASLIWQAARKLVAKALAANEETLWTVALVVAAIPVGAVLWGIFGLPGAPSSKDAQNLATAVAGLFALGIVYATLRRSSAMEKQLKHAAQAQQAQRIEMAVDLLVRQGEAGKPNMAARTGGLLLLSRLISDDDSAVSDTIDALLRGYYLTESRPYEELAEEARSLDDAGVAGASRVQMKSSIERRARELGPRLDIQIAYRILKELRRDGDPPILPKWESVSYFVHGVHAADFKQE